MEEYIEYLKAMIKQEEDALAKCKQKSYGKEIENAIQRRLDSFKHDLDSVKQTK